MRKMINNNDSFISNVLQKTEQLKLLNEMLQRQIDVDIREFCQAANFHQGILVIIVPNGSVATRLRFSTPDLINRLRKEEKLYNLGNIEIKISQPPSSRKKLRKSKVLSSCANESLAAMKKSLQ